MPHSIAERGSAVSWHHVNVPRPRAACGMLALSRQSHGLRAHARVRSVLRLGIRSERRASGPRVAARVYFSSGALSGMRSGAALPSPFSGSSGSRGVLMAQMVHVSVVAMVIQHAEGASKKPASGSVRK